MRRRRRSSELHSVTLFPFLAVLICTFGVLIILLVIVVKAADTSAQSKKSEQQARNQRELTELNQRLELQEIRADGYRTLQPELLSDLASEKLRQARLQSEIEALADETELLNRQLEYAQTDLNGQGIDDARQRLVALQQQLEDEKDLLDKKRNSLEQWNSETKFSVVPYSGANGTTRRPIYIECRAETLTIQPYGIELVPRDFVQPILPNNPLDAALIAVKEYFIKNKLFENKQSPYPLLIVRPDGPDSYALARHAMKSWDEEFGYELIAADKELVFGEKDKQLESVINAAVVAAKSRQQKYVAEKILSRGRANSRVDTANGLFASGEFGGFVNSDGRVVAAAAEKPEEEVPDQIGNQANSKAKRQADIAIDNANGPSSIAIDKGKDWALPSKSAGAVAYRRPVRVFLSSDRMILDSDSQYNQRVQILLSDPLQESVDQLVEAIWQRIDKWGVAGVGAYWKPELDVKVLPGGVERFHQMRLILENSGIELRENSK